MTPEEFLHNLKNLPEDSLLTPAHIVGIVEILRPLIKKEAISTEVDYDKLPGSKYIDEKALAEWICQSVHTIRKWREIGGVGPKFTKPSSGSVRYKVGHVREWLDDNIYTSTTDYDYRNRKFEGMTFLPPIPSFTYGSQKVEFFESIERDGEPDSIVLTQYEEGSLAESLLKGEPFEAIPESINVLVNGRLLELPLEAFLEEIQLDATVVAKLIENGLKVGEQSSYFNLYQSINLKNNLEEQLPSATQTKKSKV